MEDSRTLKTVIQYDSVILLLEIYTKEMKTLTQKDICTFIFMAALFTIVKTNIHYLQWIKELWYIYYGQ